MIISVFVALKDVGSKATKIRDFLDKLSETTYPKGMIEVVFAFVGTEETIDHVYNGSPLVKVKRFGTLVEALNTCLKTMHGKIIIFADTESDLRGVAIGNIVRSLLSVHGIIISNRLLAFRHKSLRIPLDLFDFTSFMYLDALTSNDTIVGNPGKLNRKEALRFLYKIDNLRLSEKLRILVRCL